MKTKMQRIGIAGLLFAGVTLFCVMAQPQKPDQKVHWHSEGVYYHTNNWVWDDERNTTNPQPTNFFYTKTVITTNRAEGFYFRAHDRSVDIGFREDGVVVWRYVD